MPLGIAKVVAMVAQACGKGFDDISHAAPPRANEDACFWISSEKLISATSWKPSISLEEGISRMVEWGRKYPEIKDMPTNYEIRP
mgnify:CR=1 FL=1